MYLELTEEDNNMFLDHLEAFNEQHIISEKITMDSYIKGIDIENDVNFFCRKIKPIIPGGCVEDNIPQRMSNDIGRHFVLNMNLVDSDLRGVMTSFLRDLKIKYLIEI